MLNQTIFIPLLFVYWQIKVLSYIRFNVWKTDLEYVVAVQEPEHNSYKYNATRISDFHNNIFNQFVELLIMLTYCDWQLSYSPSVPYG